MNKNIKSLIIAFAVCAALAACTFVSAPKNAFAGETFAMFSYTGDESSYTLYGGSDLTVVSESEAAAAGVPSGFSGGVFIARNKTGKNGLDVTFDYSQLNIKRGDISGVSFRIYIKSTSSDNSSYPEFRMPVPSNKNSWLYGGGKGATKTDEWVTIKLTAEQIDKLCINGELKTFVLCLRTAAETTMYIEELKIDLLPVDTEAPVITAPITRFKTTEGTYPLEDGVTITDDSGSFTVEYIWSEGALDRNGRLTAGNHTLTIKATDARGNFSEKVIEYIVEKESDEVDPDLMKKCKITFRGEGLEDYVVEYIAGEADLIIDDIHPPKVPNKPHYIGIWQDWTLEKTEDQIVYADYAAIAYTVTFKADGKVYKKVTYTADNLSIKEPAVPEKKGYDGKWSEYTLDFSDDLVVEAVYTKSEEQKPAKSGCGSSLNGSGFVFAVAALGLCAVLKRKKG